MPHLQVQRQGGTREQIHKNTLGSSLFIALRGRCPKNRRLCNTRTHTNGHCKKPSGRPFEWGRRKKALSVGAQQTRLKSQLLPIWLRGHEEVT